MYFSTNFIKGIKSRKRAQTVHVSCMGEIKNPLKTLVGYSKRKKQLKERQVYIKNITSTDFTNILTATHRSG
jgi:hypothetical protein